MALRKLLLVSLLAGLAISLDLPQSRSYVIVRNGDTTPSVEYRSGMGPPSNTHEDTVARNFTMETMRALPLSLMLQDMLMKQSMEKQSDPLKERSGMGPPRKIHWDLDAGNITHDNNEEESLFNLRVHHTPQEVLLDQNVSVTDDKLKAAMVQKVRLPACPTSSS